MSGRHPRVTRRAATTPPRGARRSRTEARAFGTVASWAKGVPIPPVIHLPVPGRSEDGSMPSSTHGGYAGQPGLYDPAFEHDACGVAFVATLRGTPGRDIVDAGLTALLNLDHRGAVGAEPDTGDGAGILTQIPDAFVRDVVDAELPAAGYYAIGTAFLPADEAAATKAVRGIEALATEEKLEVLAWRDVPVVAELVGPSARAVMPAFRQLVVADPARELRGIAPDRRAFRPRGRQGVVEGQGRRAGGRRGRQATHTH